MLSKWFKRRISYQPYHTVVVGDYKVYSTSDYLPALYESFKEHAELCDEYDLYPSDRTMTHHFLGIGSVDQAWPRLVIVQGYDPGGFCFPPGVLIVPETQVIFIGAGERLLAYQLDRPRKIWEDKTCCGFLGWRQHGSFVILSAKLECAAWTTEGEKLWTAHVEPPWSYRVEGTTVHLEVMGTQSQFPIHFGPGKECSSC